MQNFLDPAILFFVFGLLAGALGVVLVLMLIALAHQSLRKPRQPDPEVDQGIDNAAGDIG